MLSYKFIIYKILVLGDVKFLYIRERGFLKCDLFFKKLRVRVENLNI